MSSLYLGNIYSSLHIIKSTNVIVLLEVRRHKKYQFKFFQGKISKGRTSSLDCIVCGGRIRMLKLLNKKIMKEYN